MLYGIFGIFCLLVIIVMLIKKIKTAKNKRTAILLGICLILIIISVLFSIVNLKNTYLEPLNSIIRLILWLGISVIAVKKINQSKIIRKKPVIVLTVLLSLFLINIPIENQFIRFESPEELFHYNYSGEIYDIINGKDSCMIIYLKKDDTTGAIIMRKTEKGYKGTGAKRAANRFDIEGNLNVYHVKGTSDFYLSGFTVSGAKEVIITDSADNKVKTRYNIDDEYKIIFLYTYIENYTEEYYLLVNGKKTSLTKQF